MMIPSEFDEALRQDRVKSCHERRYNYIMDAVKKFPEIIELKYNDSEKSEPKPKTIVDEIVDSVFESLKGLSPCITYFEVKNQVTDYINRNNLLKTV